MRRITTRRIELNPITPSSHHLTATTSSSNTTISSLPLHNRILLLLPQLDKLPIVDLVIIGKAMQRTDYVAVVVSAPGPERFSV